MDSHKTLKLHQICIFLTDNWSLKNKTSSLRGTQLIKLEMLKQGREMGREQFPFNPIKV